MTDPFGPTNHPDLPGPAAHDASPRTPDEPRGSLDRRYKSALQTQAWVPIGQYDVELSQPLPELPQRHGQSGHHQPPEPDWIEILVRLHGRPIGMLSVPVVGGSLSAEALADHIDDALGTEVARHLAADGLSLPAARATAGAASAVSASQDQFGCGSTGTACRPAPPPEPPTVVVTTIGPTPSTAALLRALAAQTCRPAEVLVVDNRPATSGAQEFVEALSLPGVRYVAEPRRGLSHARNAGLAEVASSLVAFTDDDVLVDDRWLEFLAGGFEEPDVACVTGLILPTEVYTPAQLLFEQFGGFSKGFEQRRFNRDGPSPQPPGGGRPDPLYPFAVGVFGSGANAAFRSDALRELGGFDVRLGAGTMARGGEDLDVHLSVIRAGGVLRYEPAALLRHAHYRDIADLRRQVHSYGVGLGAMMTKRWACHPADRRELVHRLPAGLGHLLRPGSDKNTGKSAGYPKSLTATELTGVLLGPPAYLASAGRERLRRLALRLPATQSG